MGINKISMYVVPPSNKVQESEPRTPVEPQKDNATVSDRVELSNGAKEMLQARRAMMEGDDIRAGHVERLKKMLEDNTYKVDADKLADKMLDAYLPK